MIKKIFSNSIIYTFGPQLSKIVGFFLLPFITPYLSKIDFGVWGSVMAYVFLFTAARDLGMLTPLVNSFYRFPTKWKWVWRQIFTFLLLFGILFVLIQGLVLYIIIPREAFENRWIIILLVSIQTLIFDVPNQIGFRVLQLKEKPIQLSLISVFSGFIALGIQIYTVVYLKKGYMGWFYSTFFSSLVSFLCFLVILYNNQIMPILTMRYKYLKENIKISLPMLPHSYSSYLLGSADRMIMNVYKVKTQDIGVYNIAYMWGNYVDIVGNAVGFAVSPTYFKLFTEKNAEEKLYHLTQFLQTLFLIGPFLVSLFSKELFHIFIKNPEFKNAYPLSIIIIMGYSYRPLYWNIVNRLQFNNLTTQLWKITLIGGVLNLVLNLIFMPILGYQIASIVTFISLIYIGISGYNLKAYKNLQIRNYNQIKWIFTILIFSTFSYLLKDLETLFKTYLSLIVVFASAYYLKIKHIQFLK